MSQPATHSGSYDEALRVYGTRDPALPQPTEVAWEVWTARPGEFPTRKQPRQRSHWPVRKSWGQNPVVTCRRNSRMPPMSGQIRRRIGSAGIARAIATIPAGGVSGPIEDRGAWHLVRVVARRPMPVPTPAAGPVSVPSASQGPFGQPPVAAPTMPSPTSSILRVRQPGEAVASDDGQAARLQLQMTSLDYTIALASEGFWEWPTQ